MNPLADKTPPLQNNKNSLRNPASTHGLSSSLRLHTTGKAERSSSNFLREKRFEHVRAGRREAAPQGLSPGRSKGGCMRLGTRV